MTVLACITWRRMLEQWCPYEPTPEVRLVCWLLATAITDEPGEALDQGRQPFVGGFFAGGFQAWCSLVRLNPQFVMEQIARANASKVRSTAGRPGRPVRAAEVLA